jgi:hypothetical protein
LALVLTAVNAVKPMHIDDTTYYLFARHIAAHPLDPYGFYPLYFNQPLPANHILAPPVFLYWLAAGIRLLGEQPMLWKMWVFPFHLAFVVALFSLTRRFARGLEVPLTWMTALSPAVLPSANLMIDVPALALGLVALAIFCRACEAESLGQAVLAGLMCGLAMQTKYTAFLFLAIMTAYAIMATSAGFWKRTCLWVLTAGCAAALFASWEAYLVWRYGESHFIYHLINQASFTADKAQLVGSLLLLLGQLAAPVALLGLAALGTPGSLVAVAVLAWTALYMAIGLAPASLAMSIEWASRGLGLVVLAIIIGAGWRSLWFAKHGEAASGRNTWFLLAWVILEALGYFAMTPFPAARRLLGLVIASTMLAGSLAARTCVSPNRLRLVWSIAAGGALLGLGFEEVDIRDAQAEREAVTEAAEWIRHQDAGATIWYVGYWGFQYYAEQAGMKQVIPWYRSETGMPEPSRIRQGDWLIAPGPGTPQQLLQLGTEEIEVAKHIAVTDRLRLSTVPGFYNSGQPLVGRIGARFTVVIARAKQDFVPMPQ